MQVLCDVLLCENYDTAIEVLEKDGWTSETLFEDDLAYYEINTDVMLKYKSFYDTDALCGCAYDEDKKLLLVIKMKKDCKEILNCIIYSKECNEEN